MIAIMTTDTITVTPLHASSTRPEVKISRICETSVVTRETRSARSRRSTCRWASRRCVQ